MIVTALVVAAFFFVAYVLYVRLTDKKKYERIRKWTLFTLLLVGFIGLMVRFSNPFGGIGFDPRGRSAIEGEKLASMGKQKSFMGNKY